MGLQFILVIFHFSQSGLGAVDECGLLFKDALQVLNGLPNLFRCRSSAAGPRFGRLHALRGRMGLFAFHSCLSSGPDSGLGFSVSRCIAPIRALVWLEAREAPWPGGKWDLLASHSCSAEIFLPPHPYYPTVKEALMPVVWYAKLHWHLGFEQFPVNECRGFILFVSDRTTSIAGGDCIVRAPLKMDSLPQNFPVSTANLDPSLAPAPAKLFRSELRLLLMASRVYRPRQKSGIKNQERDTLRYYGWILEACREI
ncbi:hypothetical protein PENANT_c005G07711 [Penicillium antarcticum]|uniref:Uncharacterized protein n=1 Tax=Penicillium antarcticum TaxID=416450 RepID=A0A1V6QEH2_9EURO|nr:hypothetical protein PENANT_c005G07711 [Penicillium antarcticum]